MPHAARSGKLGGRFVTEATLPGACDAGGCFTGEVTFSIVGRSVDGRTWGVAVASKFLAVGNAVPAAVADVGAIATQADANVGFKPRGLELLRAGASAAETLERLLADDPKAAHRQVGVVDAVGGAATHTGGECFAWAGGIAAQDVAIQGNILTGPEVVDAMKAAWDAGADAPLAHRLLGALAAGDAAGGDKRGRQSAALLVVRVGAGYGGMDDLVADLRVDDSPEPVVELARLLDLNDFYLTASEDHEKVLVSPELADEIAEHVRRAGHPDLAAWVGTENYEMRVADDGSWIDRRVLDLLRSV